MYMIARQCLKFNSVMFAALLVTFSLFYVMQLLIQSDDGRIQEAFVIPIFDATMPEFVPVLIPTIEKPEPIVEPMIVEKPIETRVTDTESGPLIHYTTPVIDVVPPAINTLTIDNSSMIPMVRSTPAYPSRALQRGIGGFVVVSFTVDAMGNVKDPTVTYAEPEGYFERAALQSISKWKYAAKVENGNPVPVYGVQQRIIFSMRD